MLRICGFCTIYNIGSRVNIFRISKYLYIASHIGRQLIHYHASSNDKPDDTSPHVFSGGDSWRGLFYRGGSMNWEKFQRGINQYFMYDPDDPAVDGLLKDMVKGSVIDVGTCQGHLPPRYRTVVTISDDDDNDWLFSFSFQVATIIPVWTHKEST